MPTPPRTVDVFIRDRVGHPIPGADIRFRLNGEEAGQVTNAEGRGRIEQVPPTAKLEIIVSYKGEEKSVHLAPDQPSYTFTYDTNVHPEDRIALWVGLFLLLLGVVLAFVFPDPSPLQYKVILAALSLGAGGIATVITGFLKVDMDFGKRLVIGAGGAMAVFVILWFTYPN